MEEVTETPGCRLSGSLQLDKVSGKLKIYVAEKGIDGSLKAPKGDVNLSHNVRYLAFTDSLEATQEAKASGPHGKFHPLLEKMDTESAGRRIWEQYGPQDEQTAGMHSEFNHHHDYSLQLVPTIASMGTMGYRYTWTENSYERTVKGEPKLKGPEIEAETWAEGEPLAVGFHFQLSPMSIKTHRTVITLMELIMNLWSIVGGVYVMCMLVDGTVHSSKKFVFGRNQDKLL